MHPTGFAGGRWIRGVRPQFGSWRMTCRLPARLDDNSYLNRKMTPERRRSNRRSLWAQIVGVDIGGTKTAVVTWSRRAGLREVARFATSGPASTLADVARVIGSLELTNAAAIGVACGGPLDASRGVVLSPPNLPGWDQVPVVRTLEKRFHLPGFLMNDANANALAEWTFGAGRGTNSMVFLTAGTGMGAGLVLNGELYEGACGSAGEVGHLRLAPRGPLGFGKAGSFEGFCSGGAIPNLIAFLPPAKRPRNWRDWQRSHPTTRAIAAAAARGDRVALAVLAEVGQRLGQAMALLIDTLNPEMIVIGSLFVRCRRFVEPEMRRVIENEALVPAVQCCRIMPAKLGERVGGYGAVCAALHGLHRLSGATSR